MKKNLGLIMAIFALFTACGDKGDPSSPAHKHQWGNWMVTKEATCTETGVKTRVCILDATHTETETIPISPNAHVWGEWEVTTPATCTETGIGTRICTLCGEEDASDVIPALGHDYGNWTQTTAPTCTETGVETGTCSHDSSHTTTRTVAALGHDYGNWILQTTRTLTVVEKRVCSHDSSHEEKQEIPNSATGVWINAGTFQMGSPETEPNRGSDETQHEVTLTKGFYIGKYQLTQAQYEAVMGSNPSAHRIGGSQAYYLGVITDTTNFPVEMVNWYDALVFCNKLSMAEGLSPAYSINGSTDPANWGEIPTMPIWDESSTWNNIAIIVDSNGYRLPTEAQWEYACRAGTTTAFNWGTNQITTDQANYRGSFDVYNGSPSGTFLQRTTEVGSFTPNAWGLYDMHGNVMEWCWDWYGTYEDGTQTDPTGSVSGMAKAARGGTFISTGAYLRSAYRPSGESNIHPYNRGPYVGFRLSRP
jgi:formylglycine-generating enzyme required for sulfatase activity